MLYGVSCPTDSTVSRKTQHASRGDNFSFLERLVFVTNKHQCWVIYMEMVYFKIQALSERLDQRDTGNLVLNFLKFEDWQMVKIFAGAAGIDSVWAKLKGKWLHLCGTFIQSALQGSWCSFTRSCTHTITHTRTHTHNEIIAVGYHAGSWPGYWEELPTDTPTSRPGRRDQTANPDSNSQL